MKKEGCRLLRGLAAGFALWPGLAGAGELSRTPFIAPPSAFSAATPAGRAAMHEAANLPEVLPESELDQQPFSMIGKLSFRSGSFAYGGSATLVEPKVALTAGHNLWDAREGWSTNVRFDRAKFGAEKASSTPARAIYLYSSRYMTTASKSSSSTSAFAWDVGWITFSRRPARGATATASAAFDALRRGDEMRAMGYGQDFHNGAVPLTVTPTEGFRRRQGAYFENYTYGTEAGMSGGPLFVKIRGKWVVAAVVVSGYYDYSASGVRAVDRGLLKALRSAR